MPLFPPRPPDFTSGIHINDAPTDDPTRLLVHYDGRAFPIALVACILCSAISFGLGCWFGTDHYTIAAACKDLTP